MKKFFKWLIFGIIIFVIAIFVLPLVFGYFFVSQNKDLIEKMISLTVDEKSSKSVDFTEVDSRFGFSSQIPSEFKAEYLPSLRAINIYDPSLPGTGNIEKSQLYITYFNANSFLTLNTVDIIGAEKMTVLGKEAILYTIAKKLNVPDFLGQPSWRNLAHKALDIRVSTENPSIFYSFAYKQNLGKKSFDNFINSLTFN